MLINEVTMEQRKHCYLIINCYMMLFFFSKANLVSSMDTFQHSRGDHSDHDSRRMSSMIVCSEQQRPIMIFQTFSGILMTFIYGIIRKCKNIDYMFARGLMFEPYIYNICFYGVLSKHHNSTKSTHRHCAMGVCSHL